MSKKLLPCPFCGKDESVIVNGYLDAHGMDPDNYEVGDGFVVICSCKKQGCGAATGWFEKKKGARKAWNARAKQEHSEDGILKEES